jgi:hypothetical protein
MTVLQNDRKASTSRFWSFVDTIVEPPTFVANALFRSLPAPKMAFAWLAVSIVYFTLIIWTVITLFSFFRSSTNVKLF